MLIMPDVSEKDFQGMAEQVTGDSEADRPDQGANGIEADIFPGRKGTHADHEGEDGTKPVEKSKYQNQGRPESLHVFLGLIDSHLLGRKAEKNLSAVFPP